MLSGTLIECVKMVRVVETVVPTLADCLVESEDVDALIPATIGPKEALSPSLVACYDATSTASLQCCAELLEVAVALRYRSTCATENH